MEEDPIKFNQQWRKIVAQEIADLLGIPGNVTKRSAHSMSIRLNNEEHIVVGTRAVAYYHTDVMDPINTAMESVMSLNNPNSLTRDGLISWIKECQKANGVFKKNEEEDNETGHS